MNLTKGITQKDLDNKIISYVDMKILGQVNRIKDPTPKEIEKAMNEDPESNFVMCTTRVIRGISFLVLSKNCHVLPSWEIARTGFLTMALPAKKRSLVRLQKRQD